MGKVRRFSRRRTSIALIVAIAVGVSARVVVETSTRVLADAEGYLDALGRDLPAPDPETGSTVDDLGFVILTPSQAAEATAGSN